MLRTNVVQRARIREQELADNSAEAVVEEVNIEPGSGFQLEGMVTAYDAFKNGLEAAIASYIKRDTCSAVEQQDLVYGPQRLAPETVQLEKILKAILKDSEKVKFFEEKNCWFVKFGHKKYPLAKLLCRANFNHICFEAKDFERYHSQVSNFNYRPYFKGDSYQNPEYEMLSIAEKEAINVYTGSAYWGMNRLMRGEIQTLYDPNDKTLKELLLHIGMAVSGLNKLPDYMPPNGEKYLYRVEGNLPRAMVAERIKAVIEGGAVLCEMGFLSTSYAKPVAGFLHKGAPAGLLIQNLKGKKITAFSCFGEIEREVLLPPTQMQWLFHKAIHPTSENKMSLFIAKPVTVPVDRPTLPRT